MPLSRPASSACLQLWISVVLVSVLPLCLLRTITALRYSGLVSVLCMAYVTAVVVAIFFSPGLQDCGRPLPPHPQASQQPPHAM